MADLSQVELNGTTYDLKDLTIRRAHGLDPIATKTYTNVIATENDNNGAGFFYLKVRADTYTTAWHVKTRVKATIPGNVNYSTDTIFDIWGHSNTYSWYACLNRIRSTSYRAIYNNSLFRLNETGYNNGCANWVGFNLISAHNNTSSSYKRQVIVELLEYDGCSVELQDSLITPTNIPDRAAHTDWYTSTNTSFDNFDAANYGLKQTGDNNTTDISNLTFNNGTYIADSAVYRYQLLFQKDENTLTPLNNNNNTTGTSKTMLTTVEFDPFGRIAYYNSTTAVSAGSSLGAGALFWSRSGLDLRYTFNCNKTLTDQKPLYLVVTPTSNGKCKIASTTPWSQTLPATNDGNWYILLGRTYSTYQMALYAYHPVYYYNGTKVVQITSADIIGPATEAPLANMDAVVGTSLKYAREDHRHPATKIPLIWCDTLSAESAKVANGNSGYYYSLREGNLFTCEIYYGNTAQSALTFRVGTTGAKPIYINGTASSSTNYTLPAGSYIVYYDGTAYHFRTDGKIPGPITNNATSSAAGLMSAADKSKLDVITGIAVSDTEPTSDSILAWIDTDSTDTVTLLTQSEVNAQYVSYDHSQTLTSAQQNRALQNIGISDGTDAQKTNLATFAGISLTVVGTI